MKIKNLLIVGIILLISYIFYSKFSYLISSSEQKTNLIYSILLLCVVLLGVFSKKIDKMQLIKNICLWLLIFVLLLVAYTYRIEAKKIFEASISSIYPSYPVNQEEGSVQIRRSVGGHYQALAIVNGQKVKFLVDTGASSVTLTYRDAVRVGIDPDSLQYNVITSTANGYNKAAHVNIDVLSIGDISINNVKGLVVRSGLSSSLLGMSFLNRLGSFEFKDEVLLLTK